MPQARTEVTILKRVSNIVQHHISGAQCRQLRVIILYRDSVLQQALGIGSPASCRRQDVVVDIDLGCPVAMPQRRNFVHPVAVIALVVFIKLDSFPAMILQAFFDAREVTLVDQDVHVGDQALAFRLMGAAMYDGMSAGAPPSPAVARGVALHKVSRLLTYALAADAYLNFVGNEFGHPEWVELPTGDNGHSFHHARRRWRSARRRPRAGV